MAALGLVLDFLSGFTLVIAAVEWFDGICQTCAWQHFHIHTEQSCIEGNLGVQWFLAAIAGHINTVSLEADILSRLSN